jgi:hypothetical protein
LLQLPLPSPPPVLLAESLKRMLPMLLPLR